jgi:hypothetical protein
MKPVHTNQRGQDDRPSKWFAALFLSVLSVVGIISLASETSGVSVTENRSLAPMPGFSVWSLFSGSYSDSLELYYADNFPLREELVQTARSIRDLSGYHDEIIYYQAEAVDPVVAPAASDTTSVASLPAGKKGDTLAVAIPPAIDSTKVEAEYDRSAGVIIYGNRAIQIYTASSEGAEKYAEMVSLYQASFDDSLDIFCLVAPTQTDFYLPAEYKKSSNYELTTIETIRDNLDSLVHFVDAYGELAKHTKEYIYFNTDHHWTGRGAYYAYVAFCRSAGFEPHPMDSLELKRAKRTFLGSLYGITLDKRLKRNHDSIEYFMLPIPTRTFRWNRDSARYEFSKLYANTHNYTNFIGGDHPMVRIESDVNDKSILVIKDSFGNAVVPFLALHYGTVYVMDYRYFDVNVKRFVSSRGISAIMFLQNTFAANAKFTAYRGRYVLNWRPVSKKPLTKGSDSTSSVEVKQ